MRTLNFEEMENLNGGSWRSILLCAGLGAMYAVANPVLGVIVGISCAAAAEKQEQGSLEW